MHEFSAEQFDDGRSSGTGSGAQLRGRQRQRSAEEARNVERLQSPFFRPSTPRTLIKVESPGGTVRLKKKAKKSDEAKSGLMGTVANLVTVIVGSGIVGIPFAIHQSGLVAGTLMVMICAILTDKSLRLLVETGKHINVPSYEMLLEAVFGRSGFLFISFNMLISSGGGLISYLIIIKDTIPLIFGVDIDNDPVKRSILIVTSMCISLPLAMQRDMANLSKTSIISAIFDTAMVVIIAFFSPIRESVARSGGLYHIISHSTFKPDTIFIGLGVLSFAFVCQDSCFIIAGSLDRPTRDRWGKVTGISLTTCGLLATICGVCGYLAFQHHTEGNVLNNFEGPDTQIAATAARFLLGSTMFFCYPLASYVVRHVLVVLLFSGRQAHEGDDHSILARKDRRVALTLAIYVMAIIPACLLEDLGTVLSFAGAIAGSCLSYIGPGASYLAVHGRAFLILVDKLFANSSKRFLAGYPNMTDLVGAPLSRIQERGGSDQEMIPLASSGSVGLQFDEDDKDGDTGSPLKESIKESSCLKTRVGSTLCSSIGFVSWYLFLFPVWILIAKTGVARLADFEEEQSLKSPRPNRLNKVQRRGRGPAGPSRRLIPPRPPSGATVDGTRSRSISPPIHKMNRTGSHPTVESGEVITLQSGYGSTTSTGQKMIFDKSEYGNQAIAKRLSSKEHMSGNSLISQESDLEDAEEDPQEATPSVFDFFVAINFIVLGVVAMTVGIYSIMLNG